MAVPSVATDHIVSDVLCVLSKDFGKYTRYTISGAFTAFYNSEELLSAKKCLSDIVERLKIKNDEFNKIKSRVGSGLGRRVAEDVLMLYTVLDSKKASMPRFLVADSNRVITLKDLDACKILAGIADVKVGVEELSSSLSKITDTSSAVETLISEMRAINHRLNVDQDFPALQHHAVPLLPFNSGGAADGSSGGNVANESSPWRTMIGRGRSVPSSHGNNTAPTITSAPPQAPRRMITGSKSNPSKISSSNSGPKLWHLFIGKLKKKTTENDLKEYLEDNGVSISEIRKLKPVNEFQAKSALSEYRLTLTIRMRL